MDTSKKTIQKFISVIILTILCIFAFHKNVDASSSYKGGIVVNDTNTALNVRTGPGTEYEKIGTLDNAKIVKIYEEYGNWYKIYYKSSLVKNNRAYVSKTYVKELSAKYKYILVIKNIAKAYYINKDGNAILGPVDCAVGTKEYCWLKVTDSTGVEFRKGPGTKYKSYQNIPYGTKGLKILGESDDGKWYQVRYNSKKGYVHNSCVTTYKSSKTPSGSFKLGTLKKNKKILGEIYPYTIAIGKSEETGCYIHGTRGVLKLGGYYSNGCVRLSDDNMKKLYKSINKDESKSNIKILIVDSVFKIESTKNF
jgi:uncharacterized protein YgiM (DUF1202 family)